MNAKEYVKRKVEELERRGFCFFNFYCNEYVEELMNIADRVVVFLGEACDYYVIGDSVYKEEYLCGEPSLRRIASVEEFRAHLSIAAKEFNKFAHHVQMGGD